MSSDDFNEAIDNIGGLLICHDSAVGIGIKSSLIINLDSLSSSTHKIDNKSDTSEYNVKMYGFSDTSSEMIKTSENNYHGPKDSKSTSYKLDSSSINTSDINLVSVDSGRRGSRTLN